MPNSRRRKSSPSCARYQCRRGRTPGQRARLNGQGGAGGDGHGRGAKGGRIAGQGGGVGLDKNSAVDCRAAAVRVAAAEDHSTGRAAHDRQGAGAADGAGNRKRKVLRVQRGGAAGDHNLAVGAQDQVVGRLQGAGGAEGDRIARAEHPIGRDPQRAGINHGAARVAVGRVGQGDETAAIGVVDALDEPRRARKWARKCTGYSDFRRCKR